MKRRHALALAAYGGLHLLRGAWVLRGGASVASRASHVVPIGLLWVVAGLALGMAAALTVSAPAISRGLVWRAALLSQGLVLLSAPGICWATALNVALLVGLTRSMHSANTAPHAVHGAGAPGFKLRTNPR